MFDTLKLLAWIAAAGLLVVVGIIAYDMGKDWNERQR